jgi:hypothetical protein
MLKLLVALLVLAVGGYFLFLYLYPEKRACARLMTELCHKDNVDLDRAKCEALFQRLRDNGQREAAQSSAQCIAEASSCGAAVGCVAGAVGKAGVGFFEEFLKGAEKTFNGR